MADWQDSGGYDDWFDEPEPPREPRRRGGRRLGGESPEEDAWLLPERPEPRREGIVIGGRTFGTAQVAIVAVLAIALLLAILAASGAFSSSPKQAAPPTHRTSVASPPSVTPNTPANPKTKPSGHSATAPTATLKPGDTGAEVTKLQQTLTALGYSPGKADGSFGPGTKQAVMNFQTAQGLSADGVVGPKTLAALQQALSKTSG